MKIKTRDIALMYLTYNTFDEDVIDIAIFFVFFFKAFIDEIESELGDYSYFYGANTVSDEGNSDYENRITQISVVNYPSAIKTKFADAPDCGLLNYREKGYDLRDMTLKDILNKVFVETDGEKIFLKEFEED